MLEINLNEDTGLYHKVTRYPDSQQDIEMIIGSCENNLWQIDANMTFNIKLTLDSWYQLEKLVCCITNLRGRAYKGKIFLTLNYLIGARSDRRFTENGGYYLRDVIAPIINSLNCDLVLILDPHSDVAVNVIKNAKPFYCKELFSKMTEIKEKCNNQTFQFLAPDASAVKRIDRAVDNKKFYQQLNMAVATKNRDSEGHLNNIHLHNFDPSLDVVMLDDLCDGGATFINLAEHIKEQYPLEGRKFFLIVTHGLFSKGFERLGKHFSHIYATTSCGKITDVPTLLTQTEV